MDLTTRVFAGFVLVASAAVLGTALLSEYWGGLMPCELCLLQRWPWYATIALALIMVLVDGGRAAAWVLALCGVVLAAGAALAFYHVGVEQHWFAGPTACTAPAAGAMTLEQMKQQILGTAPVLCDRPAWTLFGVSMAGWNLLASLIMTGCCLAALLHGARRRGIALGVSGGTA